MNNAEELMEKIDGFLNKNKLDIQSKYFICKKLQEAYWDEIQEDDDTDDFEEDDDFNIDEPIDIPAPPKPDVIKKPKVKIKEDGINR